MATVALALPAVAAPEEFDSDGDGLTDATEAALGTDPFNQDSDFDGAWDSTEVDLADGTGSPSPLVPDSDGDGLLDGAEIDAGTSPCLIDTDGDGLSDDFDPYPTVPAVSSGTVEDVARLVGALIEISDLDQFTGNNANVNKGRRNNLAKRCTKAANAIAAYNYDQALAHLWSLYNKIDGQGPVPDWVYPSAGSAQMLEDVGLLIVLLDGGNPCTIEAQDMCAVMDLESCAPGSAECGPPLEPCTVEVQDACVLSGFNACTVGVGSADCGPAIAGCDEDAQLACLYQGLAACNPGSLGTSCGAAILCTPEQLMICEQRPDSDADYCRLGYSGRCITEVVFDPCSPARQAQCESLGFDPCEPGSFACID